jgi:hypothetical protein
MILVSSSDARSELGLGFGGLGEEIMQDCDFEEESTHSYVSCVDPDVALSYIDEKLENVLGHFQKDFEGGVSAENLGKFSCIFKLCCFLLCSFMNSMNVYRCKVWWLWFLFVYVSEISCLFTS